jgi:hypothetical protein
LLPTATHSRSSAASSAMESSSRRMADQSTFQPAIAVAFTLPDG